MLRPELYFSVEKWQICQRITHRHWC